MRTAQKLQEKQQEKQKSSELAFAAPRLVPSPGTLPTSTHSLVERGKRGASSCARAAHARRICANHRIFERAEGADAGLVQRDWRAVHPVRYVRSSAGGTGGELVAALSTSGQHAVNQAGTCLQRSASSRS